MDKTSQELQLLINSLTEDNDFQQELWVHYLSGNSSNTFAERLEEIRYEQEEQQRIAEAIFELMNNGNLEFKDLLKGFSELEQSIMCLLAMGFSIPEISKYKTLSIIRVQQVVTTIRNHDRWDEKWLLKETLQMKKDTVLRKKR